MADLMGDVNFLLHGRFGIYGRHHTGLKALEVAH
jgi:hypothetical protein